MLVLTPHLFPCRLLQKNWKFIHKLISIISQIINSFNFFHWSRWSSVANWSQIFSLQNEKSILLTCQNFPKLVPNPKKKKKKWDSAFSILKPSEMICSIWLQRRDCFCMTRWNCKLPGIIISKSILFWITLCYEGNWKLVNNNMLLTWSSFSR